MGLSNEERIENIYYIVRDIVSWKKGVIQDRRSKLVLIDFLEIIDKMWDNVFKNSFKHNDFWIFGGTTTSRINADNLDPWSVIIRDHITNALRKEDENSRDFDPFDHFLAIKGLLHEESKESFAVLRLYQLCEALSYYLKRYDDDLVNVYYADLNKNLSDLIGCCFNYMSTREEFSKAYLAHEICKIIYGNCSTPDWVTRLLFDENTHHSLKHVMEWELIDIIKVHINLLDKLKSVNNDNAQLAFDRLLTAVILSGRGMHYKYLQNKLVEACKENGITEEQLLILEKEFENCMKAKEEHAAEIQNECSDHTYDAYGNNDLDSIRSLTKGKTENE